METRKDVFLKRMFEYRIQYFIAGIMAFIFLCFWEYGMFLLNEHKNVTENFTVCGCTGEAIFLGVSSHIVGSRSDSKQFWFRFPLLNYKFPRS